LGFGIWKKPKDKKKPKDFKIAPIERSILPIFTERGGMIAGIWTKKARRCASKKYKNRK
jgi:hypothetical protein